MASYCSAMPQIYALGTLEINQDYMPALACVPRCGEVLVGEAVVHFLAVCFEQIRISRRTFRAALSESGHGRSLTSRFWRTIHSLSILLTSVLHMTRRSLTTRGPLAGVQLTRFSLEFSIRAQDTKIPQIYLRARAIRHASVSHAIEAIGVPLVTAYSR